MSFKVSFQDDTRRFTGSITSFPELMTKASSFFKFDGQQLSSLRVQYMDDERELICMSSDEEFREMMRISRVPHIFLSLPAKRKREDESVADLGSDSCFHRGKTIRLLAKSGADPEKIKQEIANWRKQKQERKVLKMREKLERKQKKLAEKEQKKRFRKSGKQFRRDERNLAPSIDSLSLASSPVPAATAAAVASSSPNPPSSEMEGVNVNAIVEGARPAKDRKGRVSHPLLTEEWNASTRHLYLDGNNMLFVVPAIRTIVIRGGSHRKTAETLLAAVAQHFASASASKGLEGTILVYDNTHLEYSQEMLSVRSARPVFATSDDALVQWSTEHDNPKELLVVTSDKGLQERLFEKGVPVMKPGRWFKMVEGILGTELFQTLVSGSPQ